MIHELVTDPMRRMSPPEPPEDDPMETCPECGALVQDDTAYDAGRCWRCGEWL